MKKIAGAADKHATLRTGKRWRLALGAIFVDSERGVKAAAMIHPFKKYTSIFSSTRSPKRSLGKHLAPAPWVR